MSLSTEDLNDLMMLADQKLTSKYPQWESWCDSIRLSMRKKHTVASLLRHEPARKACWDCVRAGKTTSKQAEYWAVRKTVQAAVQVLTQRWMRKLNRQVANREVPSNQILEKQNQRLPSIIKSTAENLYRQSTSRWAGGDHHICVYVGDRIDAEGQSSRAWSHNGKWSGTNSKHIFWVRADWVKRVRAHDLAVCDGMLTLDAEPIPGARVEVFRATWAEQGRGFALKTVSGYIARIGTTTYHAPTVRGAIEGVTRKSKHLPLRSPLNLDRLARRYGHVLVSLDDALSCGLCLSGTRNWCQAVGITGTEAKLSEVIAGYKLRPLPEALRVIKYAVKQHRSWEKVLSEPVPNVRFDAEGGFRVEGNHDSK